MSSFDIDDVAVEFYHVVVIVQVEVDLPDFPVETSELFDETQRGKNEEPCTAHQHEWGHDDMHREKKDYGEDVFEHTMLQPSETQGFRKENMLQISHVPGREEKEFLIHFKQMVFLCSQCFSPGQLVQHRTDLRGPVYFGDHIERTGRVEDEGRHSVQTVQLVEDTPDRSVTAVDDDVVVPFNIVMFLQGGECNGIDIQIFMFSFFADRKDTHGTPYAIIIAMKIENEDALDNLVICPQCHTLHQEIPIEDGAKACCSECKSIMYRYDSRLAEHGLALSIAALVFFAVANFFPLVKIELLGNEQFITIPKTVMSLFENGFFIVGMICAFLIFIFPLMIFVIYLLIFALLKLRKGEQFSKELLILLSRLKPWSMSDIFLISILVALVKLIGYAQIHMGIAFWALIVFVLLDIYLTRSIHISEIWMLRKRVFLPKAKQENAV